MNAADVELALSGYFDYRRNVIVPNVSWGLFQDGREVDVVVVRPSRWVEAVEIKVSASDIRADMKKRRRFSLGPGFGVDGGNLLVPDHRPHWHPLIRKAWFAVPEKLAANPNIPDYVGILAVSDGRWEGFNFPQRVKAIRAPKLHKAARQLTDEEYRDLLRLGCLRIWTLKDDLARRRLQSLKGKGGNHGLD